MMRKLAILLLTLAFVCVQAGGVLAAKNPDTGPGCGVGTMLWKDFKHQKNIAPQVLMATTNGMFSNTIGITFGISDCTNDGKVWAEHKVQQFAALNYENLSQEMAQGHGEHVASLATLMGVPHEHKDAFFALTQEKYLSLVKLGDDAPAAMVKTLRDEMAVHPVLANLSTTR